MSRTVKIIFVGVGAPPAVVTVDTELSTLQGLVGGYLEAVTLSEGLALWCNEDGIAKNLPLNRPVLFPMRDGYRVEVILGDFFIARDSKEGELTDVTDEDIEEWMHKLGGGKPSNETVH